MSSTENSRALAMLRASRLHWCELVPGRRVQFRRPLETEMHRFIAGVGVEHVCEYVQGWDGFTEGTLLGESVGSSDPLDFSAELWGEYVCDHTDEVATVAKAIAATLKAHIESREAAGKN